MSSGGGGAAGGISPTMLIAGVSLAAAAAAGVVYACSRKTQTKGVRTTVKATDMEPGSMREYKDEAKKMTVLLIHTAEGEFKATSPTCPHYSIPLVKGVLNGDRVTCPAHGACFNVCTGDIEDGPVLNKLQTFPVSVGSDGFLYVDIPSTLERMPTKGVVPTLTKPVASDARRVLIVGGGAAGAAAVEQLRADGYTGRIIWLSKETSPPYDRPKLSKSMSLGLEPATIALRTADFYASIGVELRLGVTVERVDTARKEVILAAAGASGATGEVVGYDKLLCATGGYPRRFLPGEPGPAPGGTPGAALSNIFPLRDINHAAEVEMALNAARAAAGIEEGSPVSTPIVVVGSSFIGMEAAAYFVNSKKCADVTVIGMEKVPFERVLGQEIGSYMHALFASNGVKFKMGAVVKEFRPDASNPASVGSLLLSTGEVLPASIVLIGAGIIPSVSYLSSAAGVEVLAGAPGGVKVNEYMQTGAPSVYAAGDIAYFPFMKKGDDVPHNTRIEHWDVAYDQGRTAAKNMLAELTAEASSSARGGAAAVSSAPALERYDVIPFFWTGANFGKFLRYSGHALKYDSVVIHGNAVDPKTSDGFVAYYIAGESIAAVATVNRDRHVMAAKELMAMGRMPSASMVKASDNFDLPQHLARTISTKGMIGGGAAGKA